MANRFAPYARGASPFRGSTTPTASAATTTATTAESDANELRAELRAVRAQLAETRLTYERRVVDLTRSGQELRARLEAEAANVQRMEANVAFIAGEEARKAARAAELEEKLTALQRDSDMRQRAAQRELQALKEEVVVLRNDNGALARQYQNDLDVMKLKLARKDEMLQQLQSVRPSTATPTAESYERQLLAKDAEIKVLQQKLSSAEGAQVIQRQLDGQVAHVSQLEQDARRLAADNKQLHERTKTMSVLEEQYSSLQRKAAHLEQTCERQALQLAHTEKEKSAWTAMLEEPERTTLSTPAALARAFLSLRHEYRAMLADQGSNRGEVRVAEAHAKDAQHKMAALSQEIATLRQQLKRDQMVTKRLERARAIAQKEIEFLRAQLDSYDAEQTMISAGSVDEHKVRRIQHLETLLAEAQRQLEDVSSVEAAPAAPAPAPASETMALDVRADKSQLELQSRLAAAEQQLRALQHDKVMLETQLIYAEQQLSRREYDPATTKVIHMRLNPASAVAAQRDQMITRLQEENRRLLAELECQGESVAAAAAAVGNSGRLAELEQKLIDSEMRMKRLKEVFGRKILEFRELCYGLTGWQIEMSEGTYRLSSMFAEREGDHLLFSRDPASSSLLLLESDFSASVLPLLRPLLQRRNSIPAITATVTLELFARQTAI